MKTYIAKWPDGSVTIVTAIDKIHLFDLLDQEGDPYCCELLEVKSEANYFHLSFKAAKQGDELFVDVEDLDDDTNLKNIKLPKNAFERHLSRITGKTLKQIQALPNLLEMKKQMGISQ